MLFSLHPLLGDRKHAISARWLANPNCACSHLPLSFGAHINICFIIKVKILMLIKWSYTSPPTKKKIMLNIEPRIVSIFWACSPIYLKHLSFVVSVLRSTPNHKSLKCRCPDYCYVGSTLVYLNFLDPKVIIFSCSAMLNSTGRVFGENCMPQLSDVDTRSRFIASGFYK
jgi:hypothetical protein